MPLQRLRPDELAIANALAAAPPAYVAFMKSLGRGEGGRAVVAAEGVGRPTLKKRLLAAAAAAGVTIAFLRSGAEEVVFRVTDR